MTLVNHSEYANVDIAKFLLAFLVVAIHISPESVSNSMCVSKTLCTIYRLAVPYFFMASGFFLFRKVGFPFWHNREKRDIVYCYLRKMIRLYIGWTVIYLPLTIYGFIHDNVFVFKAVVVFMRNLLFVGENFYSWPLWYLLAQIIAVSLIALFDKLGLSLKNVFFLSVLITCLGQISDIWSVTFIGNVYFSLFVNVRNGLFIGLICTVLGVLVSQQKSCSLSRIYLVMLAVGMILLGLLYSLFFFVLVASFCLFLWTIVATQLKVSSHISYFLRKESSVLYFTHMLWLGLFHFVIPDFHLNPLQIYLMVCILSLVMGWFLIRFCSYTKVYGLLFK